MSTNTKTLESFDLLPNVFKSDVNRALFENGFQKFLSKPNTKDVVGIIGETTNTKSRIKEDTPQRSAQQLQPMIYNKIGTTETVMSFKDIVNELDRIGVDINRMDEWAAAEQFNFAPPIDLDKVSNYRNYYWLSDTTPQYITIKNRSIQVNAILNQAFSDNPDLYALYQQYQTANFDSPALADEMELLYPGIVDLILERQFIRQSDPLNQTNSNGWDAVTYDLLDSVDYNYPLDAIDVVGIDDGVFVVSGNKANLFNLTPDFNFRLNNSIEHDGIFQVILAEYNASADETYITVTTPILGVTDIDGSIDVGFYDNNFGAGEFVVPNPLGLRLQNDPWSSQNFWTHINDIPSNININVLRRAELPIIEYLPFIEMNEWSFTKSNWKYRSAIGAEFESVDDVPSDVELHFIDRHKYSVDTITGSTITVALGDNPPQENQFVVGSEVTIEEVGKFEYYTIIDVQYDDVTGSTIQLDRLIPSDMDPEYTDIHNIRYTSKGDDWTGVYSHWIYNGNQNPIPCPAQIENANDIMQSFDVNELFEGWVYLGEDNSFTPNIDELRVYVNKTRAYGTFMEGFFDGVDFVFDIPEGERGNAVRINTVPQFGTIDVFTTPAAESDTDRLMVPVRVDLSDETYNIVRLPIIEYRKVEQVKLLTTQYPKFDVFNVDGTPTYATNSIWEYVESDSNSVLPSVNARVKVTNGNVDFKQLLLNDDGSMFAYKIHNNVAGPELRTMWVRSESNPIYSPSYIDANGDTIAVGNPLGDWEVPKQMYQNLEHENRQILGTIQLNQHFKSIIAAQPNPRGFTEDDTKRWRILANQDQGLGGTIKEYNGSFDTLISVVFNDIINVPKLVNFASSQYDDSVNIVRDIFEQNIDTYLTNSTPEYIRSLTESIVDEVVNQFERNGTRNRVFGDSTAHDGEIGVRGWMATLPMVGLTDPVKPKKLVDIAGGVYEIQHHDGHITSPTILKSEINAIISRILRTTRSLTGLADQLTSYVPNNAGSLFYTTDTEQLYRFNVLAFTQFEPSYVQLGELWFNTLNASVMKKTSTGSVVVDSSEAWVPFDLNDILMEVFLNIENRLYAACDKSHSTYRIEDIKYHALYSQYEEREFDVFIKQFGLDASSTTSFSAANAFTWNYSSVDTAHYRVRNRPANWDNESPSTWYNIYEDVYGTRYPNIEPWVLQGYNDAPEWWNLAYAGTERTWSQDMWLNIVRGIVPVGNMLPDGNVSAGAEGDVVGYSVVPVNIMDRATIVGDYAPDALLPPYFTSPEIGDMLAQQYGSMLSISPLMSKAAEGYAYGTNGPIENMWKRSTYYLHSLVSISFKLDPMNFCATTINPESSVVDGLRFDPIANRVHSHRDAKFHGEASPAGVEISRGLNQWFVNYIRYTSRDVVGSGFRSSWVDWRPRLGYQTSSFIDSKSLTVKTEVVSLDDSDIDIVLKNSKGIRDVWIDALMVAVTDVGEYTSSYGVKVPVNNGSGWGFKVDTANPSIRSIDLYGVTPLAEGSSFSPRLSNIPTGSWNHYQIDKNKTYSYIPGNDIRDLGPEFDGIQGIINFIDGYVAHLNDSGFNFNNTRYTSIDTQSNRTVDWQFETERLIEQIYTGMSSNELPVSFLGGWNYSYADMVTSTFIVTGAIKLKESDKVQVHTTGILPIPLDTHKEYYIVNVVDNTFQLSTAPGGSPIQLGSIGHGILSIGTYRIEVVSPVAYHEVNPFRYGLVLDHDTGIVSDVVHNTFRDIDVEQGLYDQYGRPLRPEHIKTFRADATTRFIADRNVNNDVISSTNPADNIHIAGAHIMVNGFEHVILFSGTTIEGNTLFDEFLGAAVSRFQISMRTQADRTFRPNVGGHYLHDGQILKNIESSIIELQQLYDVNLADENSDAVTAARKLVGFDRTEYFDDMGITPKSQFLFHRGAIQHKGATKSIQAFINSKQFVEATVDEYWAYKAAEYGDARIKQYPEVNLLAKDAATDKLLMHFTTPNDALADNFIEIAKDDTSRWYDHPQQVSTVLSGVDNLSFESEVAFTQEIGITNGVDDVPIELDVHCDGVRIIVNIESTTPYQYVLSGAAGESFEQTHDFELVAGVDCLDVWVKSATGSTFTKQPFIDAYKILENNSFVLERVLDNGELREIKSDDVLRYVPKPAELIENTHYTRVNSKVVVIHATYLTTGIPCTVYGLNVAASKLTPVKLIDYQSSTNVQTIPIWDPAKGRQYHVSDSLINLKQDTDPAKFNESFDATEIDRNSAWYSNNIGKIWWDTKKLGYTPYHDDKTIPDVNSRITSWGKQSQWSSVDLYEWVESPVPPAEYSDYIKSQQSSGESTQGVAKYAVLSRTRVSPDAPFTDNWVELEDTIVHHQVAMNGGELYVGQHFDDDTVVSIYRNGVFDTSAVIVDGYVDLADRYLPVDHLDIVNMHYVPTQEDLDFNPDIKDDGRLVQYKHDYRYTVITSVDVNNIDTIDTYYFWVKNTATSHSGLTLANIAADLTTLPIPFVVFQHMVGGQYHQSVFRGLADIVNADNRYKLRFTKDFTLRDNIDDSSSDVSLKNKHVEWVLFREKQKFNVPSSLWDKLTEALTGRTLKGDVVNPVPSLDRVLFDQLNNTTHRYGLNEGQSFVNGELGIDTVLAELRDPDYDLFPIDREEFFATHSFDTADNIERAMSTIYNTFLPDTVNRIWFAVLHDGLADNVQYSGVIKTSWIQLDGVRLLDTTGDLT